jgi:hypothetical protein
MSRLSRDSGTLVIFDRRPSVVRGGPRTEITRQQTSAGRTVTLLRA